MAYKVTSTDRTLIRLLQGNARASFAELSRATGIPESTVRRRVERLQERAVIDFTMSADPATLGYDVSAMIGLKVELPRIESIGERLRAMPEVTYAAFAMGSLDVLLQVVVQSQAELVTLLRKIADIDGVRTTETFLLPEVLKPVTAWVIPESDSSQDDAGGPEAAELDHHDRNSSANVGMMHLTDRQIAERVDG